MQGARVDAYLEAQQADGLELVLDLQGFQVESSKLLEREGVLHERLHGKYVPMRLRFLGVESLRQNGFFTNMQNVPLSDPARIVRDMLCWVQPGKPEPFFLFYMDSPVSGSLRFYARRVKQEAREGEATPLKVDRDWSPPPPMKTGIVPEPKELHQKFAGDPVTIYIDGKAHHKQLFVGGVETQTRQRPEVDAVLNLGEEPSIWAKSAGPNPDDRWVHKGEGKDGMTIAEIRGEAQWVTERLRAGKKVLVHCVAGMNRSAAVACATVMLLEGLSAEEALARVREHHPWSRPDPIHWLRLRAMGERR
jgi:hypothetical protein